MFHRFINDLKLNGKYMLNLLLLQLGASLVGMILVSIIMNVDSDPGSWFCMGTLLSCIVWFIVGIFVYGLSYAQEFQLALSMGGTRRVFVGAFALRTVCQLVLGYGLILLSHQVELTLYPVLFPAYENEVVFSFLTNWRIVVPALLLVPVVSLFIGAMYGRYGRKGMWVYYIFWMFCCLILPRFFENEAPEGPLDTVAFGLRSMLLTLPPWFLVVFSAAVLTAMIAAILQFARTQMVR